MSGVSLFSAGVVTLPTDPSVEVGGSLPGSGSQILYEVTLDTEGLLMATAHSSGSHTLLSLMDNKGNVLIDSMGSSPTNADDRVAQHLGAGSYFLSVSNPSQAASFELTTSFTPASTPGQALVETQGAYDVASEDLNGDGKPDLIVPDYYSNQILINYGIGDGTFQPPVAVPVGSGPIDVVATSLFGDGHMDLIVVDQLSSDITILKGDGQGNFQVSQVLLTHPGPVDVVAGDFSGDGRLDLAVADQSSNGLEIFHNEGQGIYSAQSTWIGSIDSPSALTVADLDGNGRPDLAVSSSGSGNLVLLDGEGNDEFSPLPYQLPVGLGCYDLIAADFSKSAESDLAAVSPETGSISIFRYDGFAYRLTATLQAGSRPEKLVAADFNGDGKLDLAAANYGSNNVSIFLGNGSDGFGSATTFDTGAGPSGLAAADFNGDGRPDLVTADFIGLTVSVLINNGDATFTSPPLKPPSAGPENVLVADLTGNGIDDLIVPDLGLNEVEVFLGRGDGTFRDPILIPAGSGPEDVAVGDFTGDGIPDLAVVDWFTNSVTILQGNGDGTFQPIQTLATGDGPQFIQSGDLQGNGRLDLVVSNYLGNDIDIYYNQGNATFANAVSYPVGIGPTGIAISDLNGDGRPDIAVSDSSSNSVEILMATGPRTYATPVSYPAGAQPWSVHAADFNNDGHPDLVVADFTSSPAVDSVLINNGNGTFQPPVAYGVGGSPYPIAIGDLNGDGNLDIVTGNDGSNDLSILMGRGNGTFEPEVRLAGGDDPYGVAFGDFTGNGHLDIVEVNFETSNLVIYHGEGDGTFSNSDTISLVSPDLPTITAQLEGNGVPQVLVANPENGTINVFNSQGDGTLQLITTIDVGGSPSGMVVGDFNGDGRPDLAVTDAGTGEVLILLGLGNGTFQSPIRYTVGQSPRSPIAGDFRGNGILDIAVADTDSNQISILYGNGDGTFEPTVNYPTGVEPISLVDEDLTGNGILEIGSINRTSHDVTALIPTPTGAYQSVTFNLDEVAPSAIVSGDINGDGFPDTIVVDQEIGMIFVEINNGTPNPTGLPISVGVGDYLVAIADLYHNGEDDLILANTDTNVVTVFSGWSNTGFRRQTSFQADVAIAGLSVVDLNNDGLLDILITQAGTGQIQTYLSGGYGVFSEAEATVPLPQPSPIIFPLGTPGLSDIVNVDNNGDILDRLGVSGAVAEFSAPINETNGTGISVRDSVLVQTGGYPIVASLNTERPILYIQKTNVPTSAGVTLIHLPPVGVYTRVIAGDLFGTGLDDLIVINRTLDEILIFQQYASGMFRQYGNPIPAGFGPIDVTLAHLDPGGLPDLVVADGSSGTVLLIGRSAQGGFVNEAMLPAGLATAGTVLLPDGLKRTSPDQPVGLVSGILGTSGLIDVAVIDHGTDRLSILQGLPGGGLAAPSLALTYSTGLDPIQVDAADLTGNGLLDLIVLNEGSHDISIFLNNGHGGFTVLPRVDAGDNPTALAVSDVTGDGVPDLVVGNTNGDILILAGNGNGTFQPYERADGTVNLAVGDLTGDGSNDFVLTNTAQDLLSVQTSTSSIGFIQGRGNGLLAPGPVAIADMNGDGIPDLIVTNTGGNDVLVYLGLGRGQFALPQEFFTGTAPVGLTVADLTDNGLPDLIVANSGSNDITILLGTIGTNGQWTMQPGPRLRAGLRPVSTTVADVYGTGEQDILVVDQDSNEITVLRGLGGGFFDDSDPLTLSTGDAPVQAFVGHYSTSTTPGIVVLNSQSNNMTYYANISAEPVTIYSGGLDPVAGVEGDFNNDGYTDLAVANNGDSRIALFNGSPIGPYLAQTIFLDATTRPTDLVVTTTKGNVLEFYVGAQGEDHAISVAFNSGSTIVTIDPTPTDVGLVISGESSRLSTTNIDNSTGLIAAVFEQTGTVINSQTQESASTGATSGNSTNSVGLASVVVTTLATAAQPLFSPSSRTLGWLIDNLVQLAQGQTAEILPLGKNEIAAVAVLLSTSSSGVHVEEREIPTSPVPTEEAVPLAVNILDDSEAIPPSSLDRFVANLGDFSIALCREVVTNQGQGPDFGQDWVWNRRPSDSTAMTATFNEFPAGIAGARPADQSPEPASLDGSDACATFDAPLEILAEQPVANLPKLSLVIATIVSATIGIIVVRWRTLRSLASLLMKTSKIEDQQTLPLRINESLKDRSSSTSSRTRIRQDLPPWLLEPMGAKRRRTLTVRSMSSTGRSLVSTFFRNSSRQN